MNWLDTETKAILQKDHEVRLAPPKAAEFALVLIRKGTDHERLVRAIRRINECPEVEAIALARSPVPITINSGLTEAEALFGQFELICCDAVAVFIRSEVMEQSEPAYIQSLFQQVLQSPEFKATRVEILEIPENDSGERFADQFLGASRHQQDERSGRVTVLTPFKKARIMRHWARRVGARIECRVVQDSCESGDVV
jgi:hypothetical protein